MTTTSDGAALDFDTDDNLLSLRETKRRTKYLNSKKILEDKVRKGKEELEKYGYHIPTTQTVKLKYANNLPDHDDLGVFETEEEKRKKLLLKRRRIQRIKSIKVENSGGGGLGGRNNEDKEDAKQKLKKKLFLFRNAFSFSKDRRDTGMIHGDKMSLKDRNHKIEDDYMLAKLRKKYAVQYDKMKGGPVISKYAGSVLPKKKLPFGSGFAASFGSTPKSGFTPNELLNGPSASDYHAKQGKFGNGKGEFALFFSWDDIRDTDWTNLGGRYDLRLKMQSDEAKKRQRERKKLREQKIRGAAVLQAREEFKDIISIEERMNRKHGRTPRRIIDKYSMMQFKYTNNNTGEMRPTIASNPPTKLQLEIVEKQRKGNELFLKR